MRRYYYLVVLLSLNTLVMDQASGSKDVAAAEGTLAWKVFWNLTTEATLKLNGPKVYDTPPLDPNRMSITYGQDTAIHQHPYMATILIDFHGRLYHICGGVLITRRHVLTAAHCTGFMGEYDHYVGLGIYDLILGLNNPGSQLIKVRRHRKHHRYIDDAYLGFPNDIAMLDLRKSATLNSVVQRAQLGKPKQESFAGDDCTILGWGTTEFGKTSKLQSAYHLALTRHVCRKLWKVVPFSRINSRHICSMFYPVSICDGDTGGPLTCGDRVVGIASWGDKSCSPCVPTVFARVSGYKAWISNKVRT